MEPVSLQASRYATTSLPPILGRVIFPDGPTFTEARSGGRRVVSAFHRGLALDHGYSSACAAKPAFTGLFSASCLRNRGPVRAESKLRSIHTNALEMPRQEQRRILKIGNLRRANTIAEIVRRRARESQEKPRRLSAQQAWRLAPRPWKCP